MKTLVLLIAVVAFMFSPYSAISADDKHHKHEKDQSKIKIPDKAAAIFTETHKHLGELAGAIKAQDPRGVHKHAEAVRELIGRIPQRATPDTKKDVNPLVRDISDAAKLAHKAGHDEDWPKAQSHLKHAQLSLTNLQSRFKEILH